MYSFANLATQSVRSGFASVRTTDICCVALRLTNPVLLCHISFYG